MDDPPLENAGTPPAGALADSRQPSSFITTGPVGRTLFLLALPVLGEQILNTAVGIFDIWLAGQISRSATSAVGLAAYVGWLASMIVMLVGTGVTALVSRHFGANDHAEANRFACQSMSLAALVGIALFILLFALAPWLASAQNMRGEAYAITVEYLRYDSISQFFVSLTLVGCASLRGVGNMRTPMVIFLAVNSINVVASLSLVYGLGPIPAMGVTGIVLGTVIARISGAVITIWLLLRGNSGVHLMLRELRMRWSHVRRILRIGLPAASDGAILWAGHFVFLIIIGRLGVGMIGEAYYAAHMIAVRVEALTYLPAVAWATASATMIGQSLGAGAHRRAVQVGHAAVLQCGLLATAVAVLYFVGAEQIYNLMSDDPLVRAAGVRPFKVLALFTPLLVVSIVYVGSLRGAGDTRFPLLMSIIGTLMIRIPIGYYFGMVAGMGLIGAWMGMYCDMVWRAIFSAVRYASHRWVRTQV